MWSAMELRQEQGEAAGTSGMSREASSLLLVVAALDAAVASCLLGVSVQFAQSTGKFEPSTLECFEASTSSNFVFVSESWSTVSSGLLQLVGGILLGALIGFFSIYVPNEHNVGTSQRSMAHICVSTSVLLVKRTLAFRCTPPSIASR